MSRVVTLNQNSDFRRVYGRGKAFIHPALVTYVLPNRAGYCRIGITTSKKIGNAVIRNRARRVIYAAFYPFYDRIKGGYDLVFVARSKTTGYKSTDLGGIIKLHLIRAAVLEDQKGGI